MCCNHSKEDENTVKAIKKAIVAACKQKFGSDYNPFKSKKLKNPFQNGDDLFEDPESSFGEEVKKSYVLNMKAYDRPQIVDQYNEDIKDLKS